MAASLFFHFEMNVMPPVWVGVLLPLGRVRRVEGSGGETGLGAGVRGATSGTAPVRGLVLVGVGVLQAVFRVMVSLRLVPVGVGMLALSAMLAGCAVDEAPVELEDPRFFPYAALGNSLTAGVQDAGLVAARQLEAYPALLAAELGTRAVFPLMSPPGCPPVLDSLVSFRDGGPRGPFFAGAPGSCAPRANPNERVTVLAVPGARVADLLTTRPEDTPDPADDQILPRGRTQLEALAALGPRFVTLWIGSNDVLGAALAGDTTLVTPPSTFASQYRTVLDAIQATGARAVVATVPDVTAVPVLVRGGAVWANSGVLNLLGVRVDADCRDSDALVSLLGWLGAGALGGGTTIDCAAQRFVLTLEERMGIVRTVDAYNAAIRAEARGRGYAVVEIGPVLEAIRAQIPAFPELTTRRPFGPMVSLDGIHPSGAGQQRIAAAFLAAVQSLYGPVRSPAGVQRSR